MDALIDWLAGFVGDANNLGVLAVLAASAALEYVVPPFPGDTVTLFGAVLITAYDWSFAAVFGAVMAGSVAGSMIDYGLGVRLARRARPRAGASLRQQQLERLILRFRRHGAWYLVINRFVPGVRAFFFVAAGMAKIPPGRVALLSALSAAIWNLGLIAVGSLVGANFDTLLAWVHQYTLVAWLALAAVVLPLVLRAALRGRRPSSL